MRVRIIAGGRVPPAWEPAGDPVPGAARRVPFRVAGLGVRAPASGRKDGLDVPRPPPGAAGVAVMGPVRKQAGQGRARRTRARPCCPAAPRQLRRGPHASHPARPDALIAPVGLAAVDRVPLPVRGRPPTPGGARPRHPAPRGHAKAATRFITHIHIYAGTGSQPRTDTEPLGIGHRGAVLGKTRTGRAVGEANRWRAGCPIPIHTAWVFRTWRRLGAG